MEKKEAEAEESGSEAGSEVGSEVGSGKEEEEEEKEAAAPSPNAAPQKKPPPPVAPPNSVETKKAVANILAKKVAGKDKKLEKMFKLYEKYLNTSSLTGGFIKEIASALASSRKLKQDQKAVVDVKITQSIVNNGFILGVTDAEKALTSGYEHAEYANYKGFESNLLKLITTNPEYKEDIETIQRRFKADELKYRTKIMEKINTNPPALILDDRVKILMSGLGASSKLEKDIIKLFNRTKSVNAGGVTYPFDSAAGKPFDESEYITYCKFIVLFNKLFIKRDNLNNPIYKYIFPDLTDGPQEPKFDKLIEIESNYLQTKATEYENDKSSSPVIEAINLIVTTLDKDQLVVQLKDYKQIYWAKAEFTTKVFENDTMYDLVDDRLAYTVSFFDLIEGRLKVIQAGETDSSPEVKSAATVVLKDFSKRISNSPNKGKILSAIKSARNFTIKKKKNRYEVDEGIYKKLEKITNQNGKIQAYKDNLIATIKDGNKTKIEEDTNALLKELNDRKVYINTLEIDKRKKEIEGKPSMSETDKFAKNSEITDFKKEVQELDVNIADVTSILSDKGIKDKDKRSTLRNIVGDKIVDKFTKQKTIVPGVSPDTTPIPDFDGDDTTYIVKPFERKVDTDKKYVRIEIEGTSVNVGGERITTTAEWNDARKLILGFKPQQDVKLPSFDGKIVFDVYQNGKITVRMNNGETNTINNEAQLEAFKETDMKVKTLAAASKGYMSKATKGLINKVGSVFSKKTPEVVPSGAPSATVAPAPAPSTVVPATDAGP